MAFSTQTGSAHATATRNESYNREEEYQAAQRAAVESVMIGRETLESVTRQGEQLRNAEFVAEDAEFKLDRAARLLRGMTWSGWLANKFTRDVEAPEYKTDNVSKEASRAGPPRVYSDVPQGCERAAQAVQNYHCNLQVLESCEEEDQKSTCMLICNQMYDQAKKEVEASHSVSSETTNKEFPSRLSNDLSLLRNRQRKSKNQMRRRTPTGSRADGKTSLFEGATRKESPVDAITAQQDEHLGIMSQHLDELSSMAINLNESLADHAATVDSLDAKSDSMIFKSKMVTRRADRLIQKKSWSKTKAEFSQNVSIRHIRSGKYLAVSHNNSLILSEKFNETCIFGVWKRQGKIFGLQNKYSRKWAGQNLLGNLACSATYFDRREEWDADEDWSSTNLLCASAGWGNGGFLLVNPEDGVVSIGGGGFQDKKKADLWCIKEHEQ